MSAPPAAPSRDSMLPPVGRGQFVSMDDDVFEEMRRIVYHLSGIALGDSKRALLAARVGKRMRALGLHDYQDYLDVLTGEDGIAELSSFVDAVSTNVTQFFRESEHFRFIERLVQTQVRAGRLSFRFWSAACATGEEPWSLAMSVREAASGVPLDVRILATDISSRALDHARAGVYAERRMAGVPEALRRRYFTPLDTEEGPAWEVGPALREYVVFKRFNLVSIPFPLHGPFDVILCRNVMIYFDAPTRQRLVAELHRLLRPGGHLVVGHAESMNGVAQGFARVQPAVFVRI